MVIDPAALVLVILAAGGLGAVFAGILFWVRRVAQRIDELEGILARRRHTYPTANGLEDSLAVTIDVLLEGHPHDHPGWEGFEQKLNRDGCVVKEWGIIRLNGRRVRARELEVAPPRDPTSPCSTNCLRAMQPVCDCSCQGMNHGKENKGLAETGETWV